ncbi:nitrate reductase [NADH] [Physcomitrium patens]|uniref:Nitrate reductase n=1 Tax=Physcomitrium patens TaxID=3218 RepID=A0A2K1JYE3_PHYPA|nr:nitrate reductase [NADH]-like [Physcomitrium patens]PNR46540.1 hypothetical protein PHYPA_013659 [Physcomitrium patens]|eukprot:XP_024387212.1 nitrate reductase [NADH]-like [Physcomitrella patens]
MGVSVASPVLSNEVLGHHDADLLKTKLVSKGGFQPPKLLQEEMAPSSIIKSLAVVDTDEFDDDSTSEDEKVMEYVKEIPITDVDERDKGTSDDWIPRHPELVRLTGRHPFNCEPPLSTLMEAGFLTPTSLHYVRNHGAVPRASWDDWKVDVSGLVKRPMSLTMNDILRFRARELPVTLVCAGNRRKEENMVKQSIGFNWGAAAVSTSIWRGVLLCDVLRHCGVVSRKKGALYVCFEGAEILPGGGGSTYGTSITIETAMDEAQDVMLAYQQNGQYLEPDHGFPIRLIIPGYIGGRMVKWLNKIEVTSRESGNYYHFHDNRVLPSHVDAETAKAEGWWYRPDYIINQLNINSAISSPAHGETLPVNFSSLQEPYIVKGYAYSGGGRKVTRVEVSLDDGKSWTLCDVKHPEEPTRYGKYWCWCFWQIGVDVMDLLKCKEIVVRAWDAGMNTQPQHLIWNVMGMMNNCWFRVKVGISKFEDSGIHLAFEHPTRPGNQVGGWMTKSEVPQAAAPVLSKVVETKVTQLPVAVRQIPVSEVRKHQTEESCWIIVRNKVYDCTPFLNDHPGGADSILINGGMDSTEEFDAIHSAKAQTMLEEYYIGDLSASTAEVVDVAPKTEAEAIPTALSASGRPVALSLKERIAFRLIEREVLSHDVRRLRFALQSENHVLGLPVGKHVLLSASINGKLCMRAYTPTSNDDDVGYLELVIKVYFKDVHPKFPMGGMFSQHLDTLRVGDTIEAKGPVGHIVYEGKGQFLINGKPKFVRRVAMLAGGTGITPMYQVIRAIVSDPEDKTQVWLLYSNRTEEDIMLRKELDAWQEKHNNLVVRYTLTGTASEGWRFSKGRISEAMVKEHIPEGGEESLALLCGPQELIQEACIPCLLKHKYEKSACLEF